MEFNIATDRRDRLQKATNIKLLDDRCVVAFGGVLHLKVLLMLIENSDVRQERALVVNKRYMLQSIIS